MSRGGSKTDETATSSLTADVLEAYAEASGGAFVAVTGDGARLSASERFASMWGIPEHVLAKRSTPALVAWLVASERDGSAELATLLTTSGTGDRDEGGEITTSDGRCTSWRVVRLRDNRGRVWAFQDVTASRQAAAALRDAGNLLRILEAHTDGVVLELDVDARIVGIWATSADLFAGPDRVLQGKRIVDAIGEPQGSAVDALVRRVFATRQPATLEYDLDGSGDSRVFAAHAVLMPGGDGEAPRVTVTIRDVTAHARLRAQLFETERLMSVGLLAAGVAHEINNPLAYALLNLERIQSKLRALAATAPGEVVSELIEAARLSLEGCRRVETIVRDLNQFAGSRDDESRVTVDVRRVLEIAIEMAAPEIGDGTKVVRELGDVPCVLASEGRLSQVFLNLLVNAAQAIPEDRRAGSEIRVVTTTDGVGRAVVEIRDTGLGMSAEVMRHIFDPFYTTKAPGRGTGLGLAMCRSIATSLGGTLDVESVEGRGSVFRLKLPAGDVQDARARGHSGPVVTEIASIRRRAHRDRPN